MCETARRLRQGWSIPNNKRRGGRTGRSDITRDELEALIERIDSNGDGVLDESEYPACDYDQSADNPRVAYWHCLNDSLLDAEADSLAPGRDTPAPVREEAAPTRR